MRLLLIDYRGTIDRLPDPVAFVKALQDQGDIVCLYTGTSARTIEQEFPGLPSTVHRTFDKGGFGRLRDLPEYAAGDADVDYSVTEVVVVDDDAFYALTVEDLASVNADDRLWRFVHATQIESLLKEAP